MGSVCCATVRDKTIPNRTGNESFHGTVGCSPPLSFRWDGRALVEVSVDTTAPFSPCDNRVVDLENKGNFDAEIEPLSGGGSPFEPFQTPTWPKSPTSEGTTVNVRDGISDSSMGGSNLSTEDNDFTISPPIANQSNKEFSLSKPMIPKNSTPLRPARCSPGHPKFSSSRAPALPESSDGWSMQTFSELVTSSQRERWSLESQITRSNSQQLITSPSSVDYQSCGVCSKLLTERSSWSSGNIVAIDNELSIVSILVCGHVYHAECLENATPEVDRYDPSCPLCMSGKKMACVRFRPQEKRQKMSRIGVADIDLDDADAISGCRKSDSREGKGGPFLRRHFSIGHSKPSRSMSENESSRRKGFWGRYWKE